MQESDQPSPVAGPTFERMVDRALDFPEVAAAIDAAGAGASRAELRAGALEARVRLVGVAAVEYGHYLALRTAAACGDPGHAASVDDDRKKRILPVLAVLVPSLGAVATGVFLLCGFGLRAFAVRPHIDDGLVMAGVIAAAVTAGAALGDLAWIVVMGARGRSGRGGDDCADRDPEVRRAREAWEDAVLERGLVPFLLQDVQAAPTDPARVLEGRAVGAEDSAQ
ncbi:hypothetical protein [Streptomyces glomeratus]|uniref:Membrane protein n=1 Tax=Streptomyces glomeratus TaxID=284452 RepID=A0ABP6LNM5_9ACTN|nr:hypothetical protein [Streptomyces glomeratus]MCF1509154.1 hypothetical protein [Streptomyces glomeratus]